MIIAAPINWFFELSLVLELHVVVHVREPLSRNSMAAVLATKYDSIRSENEGGHSSE
jgi:hypothetical protein